jgi:hypothetical protein
MKYIKTFEIRNKNQLIYKIGDYVLLDLEKINQTMSCFVPGADGLPTKIPHNHEIRFRALGGIFVDDKVKIIDTFNIFVYPYVGIFYNNDVDDGSRVSQSAPGYYFKFKENEIIRKLTPEEIKDFETKKEALKYNL